MQFAIDPSNSTPLYAQIAAGIRAEVASGNLAAGDRLPAGRDLASAIGVTLETVQRAYRELASEGIVVSRVGRGTTIATDVDIGRMSLGEELKDLVARARRLGVSDDDLRRGLEAHLG